MHSASATPVIMIGFLLKEKIAEFHLTNIQLLPYQPRELMPEIIAFSDIQFIFMEPEIAAQGFPSKVYTIMACGKPLVICSPENTPIVNFLSPMGCAEVVTESDSIIKAQKIMQWLDSISSEELRIMGQRGVKEIMEKYSKENMHCGERKSSRRFENETGNQRVGRKAGRVCVRNSLSAKSSSASRIESISAS